MSALEQLVLDGLALNDGTVFDMLELEAPPAPLRQRWVSGDDADGDVLAEPSRRGNRTWTVKLRVAPQATADLMLAKIGQIQDKLFEAEQSAEQGGLPAVWTPTNATKAGTLYVLSGEITGLPITIEDGWTSKAPVIELRLDARPFLYGVEITTVLDSFATDTITNYTFDTGGGTLSVTGGVLVPSSTAEKRLYRSLEGLTYANVQTTVKVTTGASVASGSTLIMLKRLDASNYLRAGINFAGAASTLTVEKVVAGTPTTLTTSAVFTPVAATSYWIRARNEGNLITVEYWTSAPTATGASTQKVSTTLAGSDVTTFGLGVGGQTGLRLLPQATDYRWDDLEIVPNTFTSRRIGITDLPWVIGSVHGVAGDVPAEARLVVTDNDAKTRRHLRWALRWRYFDATTPDNITDRFADNTIGTGAWAFDAGAGTLSISAGQLVPSSTAEKRLYRSDVAGVYTDARVTVKVITGASVASGETDIIARRSASNTFLEGRLTFAGAASTLSIFSNINGTATSLGSTGAFTVTAATTYWLRFAVQGTNCTVTLYTSDPAAGAAATQTLTVTLSSADSVVLASGNSGLRLLPQATDYRWDDYFAVPLAGSAALVIDSDEMVTSGFTGVQAVSSNTVGYDPNAASNEVVRSQLYPDPVAVCGLGNLGHVGSYRAVLRCYPEQHWSESRGADFKVRLTYKEGDGPLRSNPWVSPRRAGDASELDLGIVTIPPKTLGAQRWTGQIEAYSFQGTGGVITGADFFEVDYCLLFPVNEGYGLARAPYNFDAAPVYTGKDDFTGATAGSLLNGRTAPLGGTWATSGATTDFAFADAPGSAETISRATLSDLSPRIALLGSTTYTGVQASVQMYYTSNSSIPVGGLILRAVDTSNYAFATFDGFTGTSLGTMTAGTPGFFLGVDSQREGVLLPVNTWYTLRALITIEGYFLAQVIDASGVILFSTWVSDGASFGTGSPLASGKSGITDRNPTTPGSTRYYDAFWTAPLTPGAVIFPGRSVEINSQKTERADSTGAYYGPVPSYRGTRFYLPPAGDENRASQIVVAARRDDELDSGSDYSIFDVTTATVSYTPRWSTVPR